MGITSYPNTPRLVNRFSLGADPEFTFYDALGAYTYAEALGLNTMQAFGCDMAGRQAEIRAYPSRFALEVVASIVDSLRWMAYRHPDTLSLNWVAMAYNGFDGCGGHVHFGRKRASRLKDVNTLDSVTKTLLDSGVLDLSDFKSRRNARGKYGQYGDFRVQSHGYEYRTFPTQLNSPWLTYFVLVVSKLAVHHGSMPDNDVVKLLYLYKDRDDDAAIAFNVVGKRGVPKAARPIDFKANWGISRAQGPKEANLFFPSSIKPENATCRELFQHLMDGTDVPQRTPRPTWSPFNLPNGFYLVGVQSHSLGHLPDIAMNLISKGRKVRIEVGIPLTVYHNGVLSEEKIRQAFSSRFGDVSLRRGSNDTILIQVPADLKESSAQCKYLNHVLGDTSLFPVSRAENFSSTDWSQWDSVPLGGTAKPLQGRLLARIDGKKPKLKKPLREEAF